MKLRRNYFGAYVKGREAFKRDGDSAICPYLDRRGGQYCHVVTFSRAYQRYWREGLEDERNQAQMRYTKI